MKGFPALFVFLLFCIAAATADDAVTALQKQVTLEIREQRLAEELRRSWQAERTFLDNEIARLEEELRIRNSRLESAVSARKERERSVADLRERLAAAAPDGAAALSQRITELCDKLDMAGRITLQTECFQDADGVLRQFRVLRLGNAAAYAVTPDNKLWAVSRAPEWRWEWRRQEASAAVEAMRSFEAQDGTIVELPL